MTKAWRLAAERAESLNKAAKSPGQKEIVPGATLYLEQDGYERVVKNVGTVASVCEEACFGSGPRGKDMHIGGMEDITAKVPSLGKNRGTYLVYTCGLTGRACITGKEEHIKSACERFR